MTSDAIMWMLGATCALWCLALSTFVAQLDSAQQTEAIKLMHSALGAMLKRSGELRREKAAAAETSEGVQARFP